MLSTQEVQDVNVVDTGNCPRHGFPSSQTLLHKLLSVHDLIPWILFCSIRLSCKATRLAFLMKWVVYSLARQHKRRISYKPSHLFVTKSGLHVHMAPSHRNGKRKRVQSKSSVSILAMTSVVVLFHSSWSWKENSCFAPPVRLSHENQDDSWRKWKIVLRIYECHWFRQAKGIQQTLSGCHRYCPRNGILLLLTPRSVSSIRLCKFECCCKRCKANLFRKQSIVGQIGGARTRRIVLWYSAMAAVVMYE